MSTYEQRAGAMAAGAIARAEDLGTEGSGAALAIVEALGGLTFAVLAVAVELSSANVREEHRAERRFDG